MSGTAAELKFVTHRYGNHVALREVSISSRPGEVVALLGPNGAGKTTAVKLLLGLLPVQKGSVTIMWSGEDDPLTERERQILLRAGEGRASAEIARELMLSEGTVRNYLSEAISKLGAANRVDAARMARAKSWL